MFVDWTAYRAAFETEASRARGTRVRVLGGMELRLLPSPWLTAREVRIGPADQALASVEEITVDIDLTPLLRGEVRVLDLTLTRPTLRLALDAEGRLTSAAASAAPAGPARPWPDPEAVRIERLAITDGSVEILRPGREAVRLDAISGRLEAQSLKGPARFDGTVTADDAEFGVKLGAGALQPDGSVRLKATITPDETPLVADFDGTLTTAGGAPVAKGAVSLGTAPPARNAENPPTPWHMTASVEATPRLARFDGLELIAGPAERALTLTGGASLTFATPARFDLSLGARQLDLDRFLGRREADLSRGVAPWLESRLAGLALPPPARLTGRVHLDSPALILGGAVISGTRIEAAPTATGWRLIDATTTLPGRSRLSGNGALVPGTGFTGALTLSSEQPALLASWLSGPDPSGVSPALPPASLGLDGRISTDAIRADRLRIGVGTAELSGKGLWQFGAARSLDLTLAGRDLDLDAAAALVRMAGSSAGGPAALRLTLGLDRFSVAGLAGHGIDLAMAASNGRLDIDRLTVADLAGAKLSAEGSLSGLPGEPQGSLRATLDASSLEGVAALLRTLAPTDPVARRVAAAAGPLSPARLEARLSGTAGRFPVANLTLAGTAGGSEVDLVSSFAGRLDLWRAGSLDVRASLTGPDGGRLLGQLGIPVVPVGATAPGSLRLSAKGEPDKGLAVDLAADALGTRLTAKGGLTLPATGPASVSGLALTLASPDLTPLALGAGISTLPDGLALDLAATASGTGARLALSGLAGQVQDTRLSGDLVLAPADPRAQVTGQLQLDRADLAGLATLALGADAFTPGRGGGWPTTAFSPVALPVSADVALATPALTAGSLTLGEARFRLRLSNGDLAIDDLAARLAGGSVSGALSIGKGAAGTTRVTARARLTDTDAAALFWHTPAGAPALTGRTELGFEGSSEGRTIAALLAGAAGSGSLTLQAGGLADLDPQAFPRLIERTAAGTEFADATLTRDLRRELAAGPLPLSRLDATLALAAGTLRISGVTAEAPAGVHFSGEAMADLSAWSLTGRATLGVDAPAGFAVTGATPEALLTLSGPLDTPAVSVDASGLTAFLTLGAYERERKRVEELEAARRKAAEEEAARRAKLEEEARKRREAEAAAAAASAAEASAREAEIQATLRRIRDSDPSAAAAPEFEARVRALMATPGPRPPAPAPH